MSWAHAVYKDGELVDNRKGKSGFRQALRELASVWKRAPDSTRLAAQAMAEEDKHEPMDPELAYELLVGKKLFGMSCKDSVVRMDLLQDAINAAVGPSMSSTRTCGLTDRLAALRSSFASDSFIRDARCYSQET